MRLVEALLVVGLVMGTGSAAADPGKPSTPAVQEDPTYAEGVSAVKRGNYAEAIRLFETVIAKDDRNANAYNWLAYSTRQSGDAAKAIPIYQKALAIDPKHRGAHEYIGEAYLVLGDLPKAKEHLAMLDKPGVAAALVGARDAAHLDDLAQGVTLDDGDRSAIARVVSQATGPHGDCYELERVEDGPHSAIMWKNQNAGGAPLDGAYADAPPPAERERR